MTVIEKLRSEISISCTVYPASEQPQIQGRRIFQAKARHMGRGTILCFLLSSTEQPFRSEIVRKKTHELFWKLDQSPHNTISKAPTALAGGSHPTVFSRTPEPQFEHPRQRSYVPPSTLVYSACFLLVCVVRCARPSVPPLFCVLAPS